MKSSTYSPPIKSVVEAFSQNKPFDEAYNQLITSLRNNLMDLTNLFKEERTAFLDWQEIAKDIKDIEYQAIDLSQSLNDYLHELQHE